MGKTNWLTVIAFGLIAAALPACSSSDEGSPSASSSSSSVSMPPKEPFTMVIYAAGVSVDEMNSRWRAPLEKKFPHITFDFQTNTKGNDLKDLIAAGNVPDLIRTDIPGLRTGYLDLGLGEDLNPYILKYKYDKSRFNKTFVDELVDAGRTGALYGLPVPPYFPHVLYYNKDIFDKFGVKYPTDGMTYDQIYDLARTLTRTEGGVSYRGYSGAVNSTLRDNPYSLPILDPKLDQLSQPEKWRQIFENFKRFYDIPGNAYPATTGEEGNAFAKGNVAMQVNLHSVYLVIPKEINWDIVSIPLMAGAPKAGTQRGPAYWSIAKTSKHKDDAFQVITEMLTDEVQMADSKKGIPTTLNSKEIKDQLGKGDPVYSTKNMKAISYYEPAPYTQKRDQGLVEPPAGTQQSLLFNAFFEFAQGKADVNTALSKLDEKLKAEVAKEKAK